jgi:hypothetical protein
MADPALGRFALLQAVRLAGTLVVLAGAMAASGNVPWLAAVPGRRWPWPLPASPCSLARRAGWCGAGNETHEALL